MLFRNFLTAFLVLLCRILGVTPDSIAAIKAKENAPHDTEEAAAARVKNEIIS